MNITNLDMTSDIKKEDLPITVNQFSDHSFDIVKRTRNLDLNFLKEEDVLALRDMKNEIQHDFETQTIWRTYTEAKASVLNDMQHPTSHSKYHQCKREQLVQFEQLTELSFQYQMKLIELEELELEIKELEEDINLNKEKFSSTLLRRKELALSKFNISRNKVQYSLKQMQLQAKDRVREVKMWSQLKEEIEENSKEEFDKDNRDTESAIGYALRLIQQYYTMKMSGTANQEQAGFSNIRANMLSFLKYANENGLIEKIIKHIPQPVRDLLVKDGILKEEI